MTTVSPRILVAYDRGPQSGHAVEQAGRFFPGAHALMLHVAEPPLTTAVPSAAPVAASLAGAQADLEQIAHEVAEEACRAAAAAGLVAEPVEAEAAGVQGVADVIMETAEQRGAEVVILGSHRRSWLQGLLFGSVSDAVTHRATLPVLVVPDAS